MRSETAKNMESAGKIKLRIPSSFHKHKSNNNDSTRRSKKISSDLNEMYISRNATLIENDVFSFLKAHDSPSRDSARMSPHLKLSISRSDSWCLEE